MGCLDARGIDAACGSHRREKRDRWHGCCGGYEMRLAWRRIDGIYDEVEICEVEVVGRLRSIAHVFRVDFEAGVDFQETVTQYFRLLLSDSVGRGRQLTVDIGRNDCVVVFDGKVSDARAHEGLGAPAPYTADAEYDDTRLRNRFYCVGAKQKFEAAK